MRASVISSRSFIRPAMFDLQLEWTVGVGGKGKAKRPHHIPIPLLIFDRQPPPWYKFISLPSLPLLLKSKTTAIIFVMKLLSTRSPKLRLLCRLGLDEWGLLPSVRGCFRLVFGSPTQFLSTHCWTGVSCIFHNGVLLLSFDGI